MSNVATSARINPTICLGARVSPKPQMPIVTHTTMLRHDQTALKADSWPCSLSAGSHITAPKEYMIVAKIAMVQLGVNDQTLERYSPVP